MRSLVDKTRAGLLGLFGLRAAIPGARLLEVAGMGHNVPVRYWRLITDAIAETARNARHLQPGAAWPS